MALLKFNCPHCGQHLEAPEEASGVRFPCPGCGQQAEVPMAAAAEARSVDTGKVCAICLSPVAEGDNKTACPSCSAEYHAECWTENGGCAEYGCSQAPAIESRRAIEIPMSYWGQENKNCPNCRREILAAAVRCRFCGATFESARPQESDEFQQRNVLATRLPAARKMITVLFILSMIPCLAPIAAVWGFIWFSGHREEVRALPSLYNALCKIGLVVATGQTVIIVFMTLLFALFKHQ
jgi:hypothetical protein